MIAPSAITLPPALSAQPALFAQVERLNGTAYFLIIRAVTYATHDLLPWMREHGVAPMAHCPLGTDKARHKARTNSERFEFVTRFARTTLVC